MDKLRDLILDMLQNDGYDFLAALELWNKFKVEIRSMSKGKHTIYVGKSGKITFIIK